MIYFGIFVLELFLLFFISKYLITEISSFLYLCFKNKKRSILILAFILLPGTFIHESSHLLMSVLLRVPASNFSIIPKIESDGVKLGSVNIVKTDIIRRFLIGTAPFILGVAIIVSMLIFLSDKILTNNSLFLSLFLILLFEISNTMFSSKKDMEGSFWILVAFCLILTISYFLFGLPSIIGFFKEIEPSRLVLLNQKADILILFPIGLNLLITIFLKLLRSINIKLTN